jgi:hypothetical protein
MDRHRNPRAGRRSGTARPYRCHPLAIVAKAIPTPLPPPTPAVDPETLKSAATNIAGLLQEKG